MQTTEVDIADPDPNTSHESDTVDTIDQVDDPNPSSDSVDAVAEDQVDDPNTGAVVNSSINSTNKYSIDDEINPT